MSNKKAPYEKRNVMVSASDLSTIVAHHWELANKLENDGFEFIAESIRDVGKRFEEKLYKSGFWVQ
jgi:hypothetical protein